MVRFFVDEKSSCQAHSLIWKYVLCMVRGDYHVCLVLKTHLGRKDFADGREVDEEIRLWLQQEPKTLFLQQELGSSYIARINVSI